MKGQIYKYKDNLYIVLHECRIRYESHWVDGIVYTEWPTSTEVYVRDKYSFESKFEYKSKS